MNYDINTIKEFCKSRHCCECKLVANDGTCLLSPSSTITKLEKELVEKELNLFLSSDNRRLYNTVYVRYIYNDNNNLKVVFEEDFEKANVAEKIREFENKYGKGKIFASLVNRMELL